MCDPRSFAIVFQETPHGDKSVLRWVGVCDTEFGRQLEDGLFEFRLRVLARTDAYRDSL